MQDVLIEVNKSDVIQALRNTTAYIGARMPGDDAGAYERIRMIPEDIESLNQLWANATAVVLDSIRDMIKTDDTTDNQLSTTLSISNNYDANLTASVNDKIQSFVVNHIIGAWSMIVNKPEAEAYFNAATTDIESALRMLYSRRRPHRNINKEGLNINGTN